MYMQKRIKQQKQKGSDPNDIMEILIIRFVCENASESWEEGNNCSYKSDVKHRNTLSCLDK